MDNPIRSPLFSQRAQQLTSSTIREILKVTERPEVISFAGGLPSPKGFPIEAINAAFDHVLRNNGAAALQYGPTEGYAPLREWVAQHMRDGGAEVDADEVLIVSGSQQALDLLGKLYVDPGVKLLVEDPSYLGALQSFSLFEPSYQPVPSDELGMQPEGLTDECTAGARFAYVQPNFQNPTGRTMDNARRETLMRRCAELGLPVIEDDPYGELRYAGEPRRSLLSLGRAVGATVIRLGSFSKVLAPGLRLGYVVAPREVIAKLVQIKQATDLQTATLTQMAVYEVLRSGLLDRHLPEVRELYKAQCAYMLEALEEFFPTDAQWTRPDGGMFIWVTLPEGIDTTALLARAVERNVAFVPGASFFAGPSPRRNTLRLSFVTVSRDKIRSGVQTLAELIQTA